MGFVTPPLTGGVDAEELPRQQSMRKFQLPTVWSSLLNHLTRGTTNTHWNPSFVLTFLLMNVVVALGCASRGSINSHEKIQISQYVGASAAEILSKWGYAEGEGKRPPLAQSAGWRRSRPWRGSEVSLERGQLCFSLEVGVMTGFLGGARHKYRGQVCSLEKRVAVGREPIFLPAPPGSARCGRWRGSLVTLRGAGISDEADVSGNAAEDVDGGGASGLLQEGSEGEVFDADPPGHVGESEVSRTCKSGDGDPGLLAEILVRQAFDLVSKGKKASEATDEVQRQLDELYINPKSVLLCMRFVGEIYGAGELPSQNDDGKSQELEADKRNLRAGAEQVLSSLLKVLADLVDGRRLAAAEGLLLLGNGTGTTFKDNCPDDARQVARSLAEDAIRGYNGLPPKVLLKMCRITKVERGLLEVDTDECKAYVKGVLNGEGVVSPSLIKFLELGNAFGARQLVDKMMAADDWSSAEQTIRLLGSKKDKEWLVEECILRDKFKMAVRLCDELGIKNDSWLKDQALLGYKRQSLLKLGERGMFEGAVHYVEMEGDGARRLAPLLVRMLVGGGMAELAASVRQRYGMDAGDAEEGVGEWGEGELDDSLVAQAEQHRRERESRRLRLPDSTGVTFVCDEASMLAAATVLREATLAAEWVEAGSDMCAMGVDVEWKPVRRVGEKEMVQILQIATAGHVVIMDIPAMLREADEPKFGDTLPLLMSAIEGALTCRQVVKLGFQVREDLRKLNRDCRVLGRAFGRVLPLVDVMEMHRRVQMPQTRRQTSLQKVVEEYMDGAWLCKDSCLSDWSRRPLTGGQLEYASLDAWVLIGIYGRMAQKWDADSFMGEYVYGSGR